MAVWLHVKVCACRLMLRPSLNAGPIRCMVLLQLEALCKCWTLRLKQNFFFDVFYELIHTFVCCVKCAMKIDEIFVENNDDRILQCCVQFSRKCKCICCQPHILDVVSCYTCSITHKRILLPPLFCGRTPRRQFWKWDFEALVYRVRDYPGQFSEDTFSFWQQFAALLRTLYRWLFIIFGRLV